MEYATNEKGSLIGAVRASLPDMGPRSVPPAQMAALNLAYIGDTVYDLYVRTLLLLTLDAKVHEMHLHSAKRVCAAGQAAAFRRIEALLGEEELAVYRRGRNSHLGTVAKNATIADYRTATGLEALIGYLYLCGRDERLGELMSAILAEETDKTTKPKGG